MLQVEWKIIQRDQTSTTNAYDLYYKTMPRVPISDEKHRANPTHNEGCKTVIATSGVSVYVSESCTTCLFWIVTRLV